MISKESDDTVQKILNRINKPVHFQYPLDEGHMQGILKDRAVIYSQGSKDIPYWDVVDLIEFAGKSEPWMRIGYYRKPKSGHLTWGSQTTITEPITVWKKLLVKTAREKPWFMSLLNDVMRELQQ